MPWIFHSLVVFGHLPRIFVQTCKTVLQKETNCIERVIKAFRISCVVVFYELLNCYNKHLAADPGTTTIMKQGTAYITPECISHSFMLGCENIQLILLWEGLFCFFVGRGSLVITELQILVRK